jgi:hypothetical protein
MGYAKMNIAKLPVFIQKWDGFLVAGANAICQELRPQTRANIPTSWSLLFAVAN